MDRPKSNTRLMRSGNLVVRKGSGKVPERLRKMPKTDEERRALIRQIARSGKPEDIRPDRPISEESWKLPKPEDPRDWRCVAF